MKRWMRTFGTLLLLLLILPGSIAAKKGGSAKDGASVLADSGPKMVWRLYAVHYLDLRQAGLMLEERIPEMLEDPQFEIRFEGIGGKVPGDGKPQGYLRILTTEAIHQRIAETLAAADRPPATRIFNVIVLRATDDPADVPDLGPAAQDALHDLQSTLRFKGYELVDSAMVRSSGRADVSLASNYALEFTFNVGPSAERPLKVERFLLYSKIENAPRHMDTSFSMGIGETVVVGTSRPFDKSRALVVLLTALE